MNDFIAIATARGVPDKLIQHHMDLFSLASGIQARQQVIVDFGKYLEQQCETYRKDNDIGMNQRMERAAALGIPADVIAAQMKIYQSFTEPVLQRQWMTSTLDAMLAQKAAQQQAMTQTAPTPPAPTPPAPATGGSGSSPPNNAPPAPPATPDDPRPFKNLSDEDLAKQIDENQKDNTKDSIANRLRYERYLRDRASDGEDALSYDTWYQRSRGGRPGNPDHQADVERNNAQASGRLNPDVTIGGRVPDGVGAVGQQVAIPGRGPGGMPAQIPIPPNSRPILESERFGPSGHISAEGRRQIRDIRAAAPNATIIVTDPANPSKPPVIFPPGKAPQPVDPTRPVRPSDPQVVDFK
jgi:hypothetical protein